MFFSGEGEGKELTERDQNGENRFSFDGYGAFSSLVVLYPILKSSSRERMSCIRYTENFVIFCTPLVIYASLLSQQNLVIYNLISR